jgi:hypothetical protein
MKTIKIGNKIEFKIHKLCDYTLHIFALHGNYFYITYHGTKKMKELRIGNYVFNLFLNLSSN